MRTLRITAFWEVWSKFDAKCDLLLLELPLLLVIAVVRVVVLLAVAFLLDLDILLHLDLLRANTI